MSEQGYTEELPKIFLLLLCELTLFLLESTLSCFNSTFPTENFTVKM
jgi:hypothetical protein